MASKKKSSPSEPAKPKAKPVTPLINPQADKAQPISQQLNQK